MLVGNLFDVLVLQKRRVGRAERRVRLGHDALRLEVLEKLVLRQVRVQLDLRERVLQHMTRARAALNKSSSHLICRRRDLGRLEQVVQHRFGEATAQ